MSHCQSTFTYWLIISLNLTLPVHFDQLADTDPEFDMFHLKCLKLVIFSSYKSFSSIWERSLAASLALAQVCTLKTYVFKISFRLGKTTVNHVKTYKDFEYDWKIGDLAWTVSLLNCCSNPRPFIEKFD